MNQRIAAALIVAAAIVFAAVGYFAGSRFAGDVSGGQRAAIEEIVAEALAGRQGIDAPATPITAPGAAFSPEQEIAIRSLVKEYLINGEPEVIRDAITALQVKRDELARAEQTAAIQDNAELIFTSSRQVVLGNPQGNVTLVEFFDYNCGYCRRALADMQRLIEQDPNLRVVLKEFPVLGEASDQAAAVAVAVRMAAPEQYGEFHRLLLSERGSVDGERALAVAGELGLDPQVLRANLETDEVTATIDESMQLASALNLTGTPSYVTAKEVIVGAVGFDALRQRIEDARGCDTATC